MDHDASFQAFVEAHQRPLMRLAYLLTGEVHLAEDLLQSVLVRMIGRWSKLRRIDNLDAYARKVMVNQYISWRRRRNSDEVPSAEPPDRAYLPEDSAVLRIRPAPGAHAAGAQAARGARPAFLRGPYRT